jgi:hypothetical protein
LHYQELPGLPGLPGLPYLQEHFLTTLPHGMTLFHIRTVRPPCPGQFLLTASTPPPFVARTCNPQCCIALLHVPPLSTGRPHIRPIPGCRHAIRHPCLTHCCYQCSGRSGTRLFCRLLSEQSYTIITQQRIKYISSYPYLRSAPSPTLRYPEEGKE